MTQYIYCDKCFDAAKEVFLRPREKYLCATTIPHYHPKATDSDILPIIAGKIGGLGAGDEQIAMELEHLPELAERICHPMRICVLADNGQEIYRVSPGGLIEYL